MSMNSMTRNVPFPNQLYSEIVNLIKSASKGLIPIYPPDFFLEYENRSNFLALPSEKQSDVAIPKLYKQPKTMNRHEPQIYENYNTSSHVPLLPSKSAPVVNCFLRAISGVPLLKHIILNHLCRRPSCILCEVHLTFRSIWAQEVDGSVVPVTCSSVIREMSAYSDFGAIKKVTPAGFSGLGPSMFCNFFFTHAFSNAKSGYEDSTTESFHFEPLMSITQDRKTQCSACGTTESEKILKRVISLDYNAYDGTRSIPFTELLEKSFAFEEKTKQFGQCNKCNRRAIKKESRSDVELPPVLVIDTDMSKAGFEFWSRNADDFCQRPEGSMHEFDERFAGENEYLSSQRFNGHGSPSVHYGSWRCYLPAMFCVVPDTKAGHIQISSSIKPDGKTYALCGALFSVKDSDGERFIAACKNLKPKISALNWTIFNDYIVTAVKEQEALYTHTSWKLPHLLFFCELDSMNKSVTAVPIPKSVFDIPSSGTIQSKIERAPLPEPGDKVALDSEFIMNNLEEHDIGRISCLNAKQEIIFDDYALLSSGEGITNYLTQYSGIVATDLAPNVSKKFLLPRKFIYMKVLYLIQNGNIFIGHALKNDFKVMNIYLPKNQLLDTAELFRLDTKQQLFSLRDLVKSIFGIDIHAITHDSVEDALYALKLYEVIVQNCGVDCIRNPWLTAVNEATQKIYLDRTNSTNGSGHSQ